MRNHLNSLNGNNALLAAVAAASNPPTGHLSNSLNSLHSLSNSNNNPASQPDCSAVNQSKPNNSSKSNNSIVSLLTDNLVGGLNQSRSSPNQNKFGEKQADEEAKAPETKEASKPDEPVESKGT